MVTTPLKQGDATPGDDLVLLAAVQLASNR